MSFVAQPAYHGIRIINDWQRSVDKWEIIDRILANDITTHLIDAAQKGVDIAKELVSIPYATGPYEEGAWFGRGTRMKGQASKEGEPPRMRTRKLFDSIDILSIERFATEFGTTLEHGYYLEVGTSKMAPRPYILPAGLEAAKLFPDILFTYIAESVR